MALSVKLTLSSRVLLRMHSYTHMQSAIPIFSLHVEKKRLSLYIPRCTHPLKIIGLNVSSLLPIFSPWMTLFSLSVARGERQRFSFNLVSSANVYLNSKRSNFSLRLLLYAFRSYGHTLRQGGGGWLHTHS